MVGCDFSWRGAKEEKRVKKLSGEGRRAGRLRAASQMLWPADTLGLPKAQKPGVLW